MTLKSEVKNKSFYILEHDGYCCFWWAYMYKSDRKEVLRYAKKLCKFAQLKTWTYGKFNYWEPLQCVKIIEIINKSWMFTELKCLNMKISISIELSLYIFISAGVAVFYWTFHLYPVVFQYKISQIFEKSTTLTDAVSKTCHCHTKKAMFWLDIINLQKKYSFNSDIYFKIQLFSKKCAKETVAWNNTFLVRSLIQQI